MRMKFWFEMSPCWPLTYPQASKQFNILATGSEFKYPDFNIFILTEATLRIAARLRRFTP